MHDTEVAAADVELARKAIHRQLSEAARRSTGWPSPQELMCMHVKGKHMDGLSDNIDHPLHSAPLY